MGHLSQITELAGSEHARSITISSNTIAKQSGFPNNRGAGYVRKALEEINALRRKQGKFIFTWKNLSKAAYPRASVKNFFNIWMALQALIYTLILIRKSVSSRILCTNG